MGLTVPIAPDYLHTKGAPQVKIGASVNEKPYWTVILQLFLLSIRFHLKVWVYVLLVFLLIGPLGFWCCQGFGDILLQRRLIRLMRKASRVKWRVDFWIRQRIHSRYLQWLGSSLGRNLVFLTYFWLRQLFDWLLDFQFLYFSYC